MIRNDYLIRYFTIFAWLILLSGCPTPPSQPFEFTPAPSGQGHFIDEMGQRRALFRTEANASIGQEVTISVESAELSGVVFRAESTGRYTVTARSSESTPVNIAVYGPRTETGLWGEALHERSGVGRVTMSDFEVPSAGDYFVLVRVSGSAGLDVVMSIDCEGCVEDDECAAESTCDLYCPDGFVTDADGCVECSCRGATCPVTGCPEGQVCVYP